MEYLFVVWQFSYFLQSLSHFGAKFVCESVIMEQAFCSGLLNLLHWINVGLIWFGIRSTGFRSKSLYLNMLWLKKPIGVIFECKGKIQIPTRLITLMSLKRCYLIAYETEHFDIWNRSSQLKCDICVLIKTFVLFVHFVSVSLQMPVSWDGFPMAARFKWKTDVSTWRENEELTACQTQLIITSPNTHTHARTNTQRSSRHALAPRFLIV